MARKDKPYLPLYVQDLLTDEKLIECSAEAHGVYFRLMCILHKQEKYGLLCLKQKHKQSESKYENFASILVRQMPFRAKQIQTALEELHIEGVIDVNETSLSQKRMINDGEISISRSITGKMGGSSVTKQYGKIGFLYWIGDYGLKNKIGISVNVTNRLYRLRSDFKLKKLMIIDTIEVEDMGVSEDIALDFFKEVRDGEWVNLSYDVMLEKFALLKASIKAKIKAKMQANTEYEYENENEDEIVVLKGGVGEKWNTKPGQEYMDLELDKTKGGAVVQLFSFSKNHSLTEIELQLLWGIFKAQNFNGEKYYGSKNEVFSHFINWSKTQNVENAKSITTGGKPKNGSSYKTAGQDAYAERLKRQLSELVPR